MKTIKRIVKTFALVALMILVDVSTVRGEALPESAYISGVIGRAQKHKLSCESRSAADLSTFWGIRFGENEFLASLPRADNPDQGFVGDPDDAWGSIPPHSYGVHAAPIAEGMRAFGLQAEAFKDLTWDQLRAEINAGRPVIVWIIGQMWGGSAVEYQAPDGNTSVVAAFEHTMILTGYSPSSVQVVDAYSGQYQTYPLSTFLKSWSVLGNMAVFVSLEPVPQEVVAAETVPETYTVQAGDYLTALAERFNTTLQTLIDLNAIAYPYTIYQGQVLQLPGLPAAEEVPAEVEPPPEVNTANFQVHLPFVVSNHGVVAALSSSNASTITQLGTLDSAETISPRSNTSDDIWVVWPLSDRFQVRIPSVQATTYLAIMLK